MFNKTLGFCTLLILCSVTYSQTQQSTARKKRPTILFNRWQEDWSVLANPNVPREPFDDFKYIPLSCMDSKTYLSLGADWRNRFESNDAMNFGIGPKGIPQSYLITRMETHFDLRIHNQIQIFTQLQNDYAPGKAIILPVDQNRLDLEQGFITLVNTTSAGTFKLRAGRQQMAFDLQRFVSVRDGPNVRQSYDALWADYEMTKWRYIAFYSHPVVTRNMRCFDDYSSSHFTYGGFRAERKIGASGKLSSYISHFKQDNVSYTSVSGNERRNILDVRFSGKEGGFDWDLEGMGQVGEIANKNIQAWGMGSISGYTFEDVYWQPRLGLQVDAASGNRNQNGDTLGTFNPLFPNGYYFTLAGYTGYTNLIHLKPSFTITPCAKLKALVAVAGVWRESTADAVYIQPNSPIPGTVGLPGSYTGTYFQTHIDWQMTPHIYNMLEIVRFNIAESLQKIGGHDSTYIGIEIKLDW